ncbi:MAG: hypothetical protein QOI46_2141 [Alphaproteobacteria bacterium]|nr:hypothetical protein [Alphaproteobacteria bacterium]
MIQAPDNIAADADRLIGELAAQTAGRGAAGGRACGACAGLGKGGAARFAHPSIADIATLLRHVCLVPTADLLSLRDATFSAAPRTLSSGLVERPRDPSRCQ